MRSNIYRKIPIAVFQDYNSVLIIRAVNNFYNCFVRKIKMLIVKHSVCDGKT